MRIILLIFLSLFITPVQAQQVKEFFYQEAEVYEFPVFVRGNLDSNTLILFIQGGPGETAIDFARSDYPRWNEYANNAFTPTERKITVGMVFRVIFSRPYNPIKYLKRKDNKRVDDLLWEDERELSTFNELVKIETSVLLLTGRYDDIGLPEENQRAHELIPNSKLIILPDAGHESFIDKPLLFRDALSRFILNH